MPNILKEVRILREEGKLHQRLITRVRTLCIIALALAALDCLNKKFMGVVQYRGI